MKGIMFIVILIGMLVTGYLVLQDVNSKRNEGTGKIDAIERADEVSKKVKRSQEAAEKRLQDIVGD